MSCHALLGFFLLPPCTPHVAGLFDAAFLHPAMGLSVPPTQAGASPLTAVQEQQISAEEYDALCKGMRVTTPPPITDDLSRWMNETQWAALQPLTQLPVSLTTVDGASSSLGHTLPSACFQRSMQPRQPVQGQHSSSSSRRAAYNLCEVLRMQPELRHMHFGTFAHPGLATLKHSPCYPEMHAGLCHSSKGY